MAPSKTQIDRLGERLRTGEPTDDDLRDLDEYRRSFGDAYESVVRRIRDGLGKDASGRRAKTTNSIIDKLRRESIRLSQIQDVAGCRLVVDNLDQQDDVARTLTGFFQGCTVIDRRVKPSYGYRAVHLVARLEDRLVEVQVRTALQHVWAQLSEKVAETFGAAVKYGGGPVDLRDLLEKASSSGGNLEILAQQMAAVEPTSAARKPLEMALAETSHEYLRCLGAIITKASKW